MSYVMPNISLSNESQQQEDDRESRKVHPMKVSEFNAIRDYRDRKRFRRRLYSKR